MKTYKFQDCIDVATGAVISTTPTFSINLLSDRTIMARYVDVTIGIVLSSSHANIFLNDPFTLTAQVTKGAMVATGEIVALYSDGTFLFNLTEIANGMYSSTLTLTTAGTRTFYVQVQGVSSNSVTVTASIRKHTLTINPNIGGTTDPLPNNYQYDENTILSVRAISDTGNVFSKFVQDDLEYFTNPLPIVMYADHVITPYFTQTPPPPPTKYKLTIVATEGGTTDPPPAIYEVDAGGSVKVTALPIKGYIFKKFDHNGKAILEGTTTIIVDSDSTLIAFFELITGMGTITKVALAATGVSVFGLITDLVYRGGR